MATLLHRECLRATAGLIIPDLGNIVNKFLGIIQISVGAVWGQQFAREGALTVTGRDLRFSWFEFSNDQVVDIDSMYAVCFHGRPHNPPFKCKLTFTNDHPDKWALIDPDANAIIGYE